MNPLPTLTGPDGEVVEDDRTATALAYSTFVGNDCSCLGCQNFRAAFDLARMDGPVLKLCTTIGIDPFKAIETTFYTIDPQSGLASYSGAYPLVGRMLEDVSVHTKFWSFTRGYAVEGFGASTACLEFSV